MILKSYELENNIQKIIQYKFILIYGENIGLKETLKKNIVASNKKAEVINLYQEDISKNKKISFILKQVNDVMSQWIKDKPENWLWIHRRWQKNLYV